MENSKANDQVSQVKYVIRINDGKGTKKEKRKNETK